MNEDFIGEMELPGMPPIMGALGAIGGIRVIETPALRYDEMIIMQHQQAIGVGELNHFRYRIQQITLNDKLRKRVAQHIEAQASRILGEPWKVSER